ncbi:hypothetical protein [Polymorphobacter fuscus]|uniref:Uncharacterized protein n=1 Tax=Sandarakinorhabdus fusca TaxID=1439888 RepID=A0A7C9GQB8_9SPHN|nr:hypothetical protein [Polymorphobacter fuscus]KAB7646237.1 hypothetical protein F9290_09265 [Polymorphobacter fuscus]MQT17450.1 hypothetical protein [Polymorphobacter fuscus]NJC10013.1 hypothetical protein [Polymorphobacter fuscus]
MRLRPTVLTLAILAVATPAAAAPAAKPATKKAAAKAPAKPATKSAAKKTAAVVPEPVVEVPEVKRPGGFMVPKAVILVKPTPAELEANAVWNLRAAMNVAALQCQYSQFLRTTKNYNSFLQAHSEELSRAQATMVGHFRRTDKARAINKFDEYTTRTYNSYSTLDAQYAFCNAAGLVGRYALEVPKGKLGVTALARGPEIRSALSYSALSPALGYVAPDPIVLPDIAAM